MAGVSLHSHSSNGAHRSAVDCLAATASKQCGFANCCNRSSRFCPSAGAQWSALDCSFGQASSTLRSCAWPCPVVCCYSANSTDKAFGCFNSASKEETHHSILALRRNCNCSRTKRTASLAADHSTRTAPTHPSPNAPCWGNARSVHPTAVKFDHPTTTIGDSITINNEWSSSRRNHHPSWATDCPDSRTPEDSPSDLQAIPFSCHRRTRHLLDSSWLGARWMGSSARGSRRTACRHRESVDHCGLAAAGANPNSSAGIIHSHCSSCVISPQPTADRSSSAATRNSQTQCAEMAHTTSGGHFPPTGSTIGCSSICESSANTNCHSFNCSTNRCHSTSTAPDRSWPASVSNFPAGAWMVHSRSDHSTFWNVCNCRSSRCTGKESIPCSCQQDDTVPNSNHSSDQCSVGCSGSSLDRISTTFCDPWWRITHHSHSSARHIGLGPSGYLLRRRVRFFKTIR